MFKKFITVTAMLFSSLHSVADNTQLNTTVLVQSIGDVETGGKYWRIGAAGERSMYQIKRSVWKKYSRVPFWMASEKSYQVEAARVADCYISDIIIDINNPTAKNVALRWNGGPNRSHYSRPTVSYANRVSNVYESYNNSTPIVHVAKPVPIKISIDLGVEAVKPMIRVIPRSSPRIDISTEPVFYLPVIATM